MTLADALRRHLGEADACSFQLMGEDLILLTGEDLVAAARAYERSLAGVPEALRGRFRAEQRAFAEEASRWLRRYNRNIHTRVEGYVALGRLTSFEYPWPAVAVLGICTVLDGMGRAHAYGLLGRAASRLGLPALERIGERIDDLLRRTNRGIFADSIPSTLLALRCHALRRAGDALLAETLLAGPLPPALDEECRALVRALTDAFGIADGPARYRSLAALTLARFDREQAVFTHHLGERRGAPPRPFSSALDALLSNPRWILSPRIRRGLRGRQVTFTPRRMPDGFDIRRHGPRVEEFGRIFVRELTEDLDDYRAAVAYVLARFGRRGEREPVALPSGGTAPRSRSSLPPA